MEIYVCCCHPHPFANLFPPSVCSWCWCAFGDRCRPSRANIYFNSLIFSSISLKYSHSMGSVKLWDERHNQQQIPPYLPVWYVWTYFHMLWTAPDSKPTAAGKHCWYEGILDLELPYPALLPLCSLFTAIFPLMTPTSAGVNNMEITHLAADVIVLFVLRCFHYKRPATAVQFAG